jgi:hypothetical protein
MGKMLKKMVKLLLPNRAAVKYVCHVVSRDTYYAHTLGGTYKGLLIVEGFCPHGSEDLVLVTLSENDGEKA